MHACEGQGTHHKQTRPEDTKKHNSYWVRLLSVQNCTACVLEQSGLNSTPCAGCVTPKYCNTVLLPSIILW